MDTFRFQDPLWLLLLIPLAAIVWLKLRRRTRSTVLYSETDLPSSLPTTTALRIKRVLRWLPIAALALCCIAIARPQFGEEEFRIKTEGIAIEMCIDRSGSMRARDFYLDDQRVNRLDAVKRVFRDFVLGDDDLEGRPDDMIGLIDFAGYPDSKCPPTLDHKMLDELLGTVKLYMPIYDERGAWINEDTMADEQSTAIGDAIAVAVDRLKDCDAKSRVIVLLSDGESNDGLLDPLEAATLAKELGVKIYTIGVGSTGRAPMPVYDRMTGRVVREEMVRVTLDEATLREIATMTGGQYFNAKNTEALKDVYARIDAMEKTEHEGRVYTQYSELYAWLLLPGVVLLFLEKVLGSTRFRSLP